MPKKLNYKPGGWHHIIDYGNAFYVEQKPREGTKKLPRGIYRISADMTGNPYAIPVSTMTDNLMDLPNTATEAVLKELTKFWEGSSKNRFDKFGLIYKRGILLHGKPGTGKTCTIAKVMEKVVQEGGVVFFQPSPQLLREYVMRLRELEPELRVLVVWEEFDARLEEGEEAYLSLLDGEDQLENVVYLATTNYIKDIPPRMKNRPSRFASVIEVGFPNEEVRRIYLQNMTQGEPIDLDAWVKQSEGFTLDHLKDLIVSVLVFEIPLAESIEKLKSMDEDEFNDYQDYDSEDDEIFDLSQPESDPRNPKSGLKDAFTKHRERRR